jgi:solute carrier family 25 phosphate transporter 23/24/25/41
MTIPQRLLAGALSGMTAATVTHPMDVVRINLQTRPELGGATAVAKEIYRVNGLKGFYKGYTPAMLSLSPFIAVNFAAFDTLKSFVFGDKKMSKKELQQRNPFIILGLGATSGIIAQTVCYPLDTVRRRMQLMNRTYTSTINAFYTIGKVEGIKGFYRGMIPNAMKVVPNNALRFATYEVLKSYFVPEGGQDVDVPSGG